MKKKCCKCKINKDVTMFSFNRSTKDGLCCTCKQCVLDYIRNLSPKAKEQRRLSQKAYRQTEEGQVSKKKSDLRYDAKMKKSPELLREYWRNKKNIWLKIPQNHLSHCISKQIWDALGKKKHNRHWEELIGYTVKQLMFHLESQFTEGMSWDNYGQWHIDHIIPISFFQYASFDDVEFKMCWRLENLQPLWAKDNLRKSNKLSLTG